jgi:protein-disulfide isomerase
MQQKLGRRIGFITISIRSVSRSLFVIGTFFVLGQSSSSIAQVGRKISLEGYPTMKEGTPELVLLEVSDFQCPYCGQGAREVLPRIHEKFVHTGKVELVYLDLPLQMHSQAFKAAKAAACAGDQKKFWKMHDVLFENQRALAPDQLQGYAEGLGLDVATFQKCLASGRHEAEIRSSVRVAHSLGITGTPAYVLARRITGSDKVQILDIVHGLPSYEELEKKLNTLLASK